MKLSLLLFFWYFQNMYAVNGLQQSLANGYVLKNDETIKIFHGDSLDILCTGEDSNIFMTKNDNDFAVQTTIVNKTTIRFFKEKPELGEATYYCDDVNRLETVSVKVVVDLLPMATQFRCVANNFKNLNCTWSSPNTRHNFSLYYVNSESYTLLCRLDPYDTMFCLWDRKNPSMPYQADVQKLTLLMKTCNLLACRNQIFIIDQDAILKLDPPVLNIIPNSPRSADLLWNMPQNYDIRNLKIDHRIQYWYSGMEHYQANISFFLDAHDCFYYNRLDEERTCEFKLSLPCADTFYEIRMSIRSATAVGEEYWSEEAVIAFVTHPEPENVDTKIEPKCSHQRVKITPEVMLFQVAKLKDTIEEELTELRGKVALLKLKRN